MGLLNLPLTLTLTPIFCKGRWGGSGSNRGSHSRFVVACAQPLSALVASSCRCNAWTCNSPYCVGCSSCEACTCAATWTDATCTAPTATQTGCTNCDGDAAGNWCNVAKQPCAGSAIAGGDYFYCGTATGAPQVHGAG